MDPLNVALFLGAVLVAGSALWVGLVYSARQSVNAHLVVPQPTVKLGGSVQVQVSLRPRQAVQATRVVARTRCLRRSVEGQGRDWTPMERLLSDNDHTWIEKDEVAHSEIEVCGSRVFESGQPVSFQVEVPLADGLPTDTQGPLTISWCAEVQFEIPGSPDVILRRPLVVRRS